MSQNVGGLPWPVRGQWPAPRFRGPREPRRGRRGFGRARGPSQLSRVVPAASVWGSPPWGIGEVGECGGGLPLALQPAEAQAQEPPRQDRSGRAGSPAPPSDSSPDRHPGSPGPGRPGGGAAVGPAWGPAWGPQEPRAGRRRRQEAAPRPGRPQATRQAGPPTWDGLFPAPGRSAAAGEGGPGPGSGLHRSPLLPRPAACSWPCRERWGRWGRWGAWGRRCPCSCEASVSTGGGAPRPQAQDLLPGPGRREAPQGWA